MHDQNYPDPICGSYCYIQKLAVDPAFMQAFPGLVFTAGSLGTARKYLNRTLGDLLLVTVENSELDR